MMLQVSSQMRGEVMVVSCEGKIVYREEAAHLRQTMKDFLQQCRFLVLDFAKVTMMDSNGVGTLVGLATSARNAGGDVKLAGMTPRLQDVLRVTKLTPLFAIYPTVDEAVERFRRENTPVAVGELPR